MEVGNKKGRKEATKRKRKAEKRKAGEGDQNKKSKKPLLSE